MTLCGFVDFFLVQVALTQALMKSLERNALDHVDRIDHVAQRLAHLTAVRIADHGMAKHLLERQLTSVVHTEHDHTSHPEEQNVPTCLQHGCRVVVLHVLGVLLRPAERREGPQTGREPCIQYILILLECKCPALSHLRRTLLSLGLRPANDPPLAVGRVLLNALHVDKVRRDTVAPPQLPTHAPVLDVFHPPEELALALRWLNHHVVALHLFDSGLGERLAVDPPLRLHDRFDHITRALTHRHHHGVVLGLDIQALGLECFDDGAARAETLHTLEFASVRVQRAVIVQDIDERQVVALAHIIVVRVVCWRDLDGTRAERHVNGNGVCH